MSSTYRPFHNLVAFLKKEKDVIEMKKKENKMLIKWKASNYRVVDSEVSYDYTRGTYVFLNGNIHRIKEAKKVFPELQKYCDH